MKKLRFVFAIFCVFFMVACVEEESEPIVIGNNVCSYGEYECHDGNSYYCGYPDSSNDVMWIHAETCHNGCDSSTGKCYRNSGGSNNNESGNNSGNNNESGNNGSGTGNSGNDDPSECTSGNFKCIGTESFYCNSLGSWVYDARCEYGCDSSTGKCKNNSNDISDSGDSSDSGSTSECTSGKYKCEGSYSYYCSNGYWDSGEYCSNGCNSSTGKCKSSSGGSNNGSGDCSDIYECSELCSSDSCLQSCYDNGSSEGRNKLDKMYDCWDQYCDQYYDSSSDDFANCIYAYCSNETYACIKSGGENYSECAAVGGTWNSSTNKCTRTQSCSSKPANTVWNTVSSITQTYSGSSWSPSTTSSYNETGSTTECRYKCASGYKWNGSSCISLPECSSTPCKDSTSGLTWSARASSTMSWSSAKSYCESYSEGGLSGWHLPTIGELRTLIKNCSATVTGGDCHVTNYCPSYSCWSEYYCRSCNGHCDYETGKYSKFGETGWLWSSSIISDHSSYAWSVDFECGSVDFVPISNYGTSSVRCVR